jgi:hypothetical protein
LDPIAKAVLNSIKCPQCKSPVDLLDWKDRSEGRKYNYCCAANWEHYRIHFIYWETYHPFVEYDHVVVYNGSHKYCITQSYYEPTWPYSNSDRTEIQIYDVDPENRTISQSPNLSFDKKLFDFTQTSQDKILNRIKTILTFQ